MWLKVVFKTTPKMLQILNHTLLEDGMTGELLEKIKKELDIPQNFNLMYDFNHYIKFNTHYFYIYKFIPDILQKLIFSEMRNHYSLHYLQTLLHPDLPFTKWLNILYSIDNSKFSLQLT